MPARRVAVIGCSTSSYDQVVSSGPDNRDWVHLVSAECPDVEFHSYAASAHGPLYYDYVLQHIVANLPDDYYDTVIMQYTTIGRWFMPIELPDIQLDDAAPVLDLSGVFAAETITPNYMFMRLYQKRVLSTRGGSHVYGVYMANDAIQQECEWLEGIIRKYHEPDTMAATYERNFTKNLMRLYGPCFKHIFCWDFCSNHGYGQHGTDDDFQFRNNIGHQLPFQSWAVARYGLEQYAMKMLDETMHCNKHGNEVLVYEYLANSRLGQHLGLPAR